MLLSVLCNLIVHTLCIFPQCVMPLVLNQSQNYIKKNSAEILTAVLIQAV